MLGLPNFAFVSANRPLEVSAFGHIRLDRDRFAASFDDLADHAIGVGLARSVVDRDSRPGLGESSGDGRADPLRRPGDDRDFPAQLPHDSAPLGLVRLNLLSTVGGNVVMQAEDPRPEVERGARDYPVRRRLGDLLCRLPRQGLRRDRGLGRIVPRVRGAQMTPGRVKSSAIAALCAANIKDSKRQ